MIKKGKITSIDGKDMDYKATTLLMHSDTPNVVDLLSTLHSELTREDIELVPLAEIV